MRPRLESIADSRNCDDLMKKFGAHQAGVTECYNDFKRLAKRIIAACDIPAPEMY